MPDIHLTAAMPLNRTDIKVLAELCAEPGVKVQQIMNEAHLGEYQTLNALRKLCALGLREPGTRYGPSRGQYHPTPAGRAEMARRLGR